MRKNNTFKLLVLLIIFNFNVGYIAESNTTRQLDFAKHESMKKTKKINEEARRIAEIIKHKESRGDYDLRGASGEYGAYQFMPLTWRAYSSDVFGHVVKQTPENQDAVAIEKIKFFLEIGYSPLEIAAIWNSGGRTWIGKKGVNSKGVSYNVEAYVKDFEKLYNNI